MRRGVALERSEPRQHLAQGIHRRTDRLSTTLHEVDVFRVAKRLTEQPLVNRRSGAERESVSQERLTEDVAERATDDQVLFDLPRLSSRRRRAPRLDVGPRNHASISTGTYAVSANGQRWPTRSTCYFWQGGTRDEFAALPRPASGRHCLEFLERRNATSPNPAASNWEVAPAMQAFGLTTEPWLYLMDADGKIIYRVEGLFTTTEVERHLQPILPGG